jgi:hypothetical protein
MQIEQIKTQQLQLLAQKALKLDELKQLDTALGQVAAIIQFADQPIAPATEPEEA